MIHFMRARVSGSLTAERIVCSESNLEKTEVSFLACFVLCMVHGEFYITNMFCCNSKQDD